MNTVLGSGERPCRASRTGGRRKLTRFATACSVGARILARERSTRSTWNGVRTPSHRAFYAAHVALVVAVGVVHMFLRGQGLTDGGGSGIGNRRVVLENEDGVVVEFCFHWLRQRGMEFIY